jgi:hypothetical protein
VKTGEAACARPPKRELLDRVTITNAIVLEDRMEAERRRIGQSPADRPDGSSVVQNPHVPCHYNLVYLDE